MIIHAFIRCVSKVRYQTDVRFLRVLPVPHTDKTSGRIYCRISTNKIRFIRRISVE